MESVPQKADSPICGNRITGRESGQWEREAWTAAQPVAFESRISVESACLPMA